jgi:hypothetical protein
MVTAMPAPPSTADPFAAHRTNRRPATAGRRGSLPGPQEGWNIVSRALPKPNEVSSLIAGLTGRSAQFKPAKPHVFGKEFPEVVAIYRTDTGVLGATLACDIEFAASAGAALTMIPADVVKECADEGEMTERLQENAHEVLNVAASLFNQPGFDHLVLSEVVLNGQVPEPVSALMSKPTSRTDIEGAIDGYPGGKCSILLP